MQSLADDAAPPPPPAHLPSPALRWRREAVIYEVYWRRFCSSRGAACGDARGIVQQLDHLQDLGVDLLWITPMYASPLVDGGYDVADYLALHPSFGDEADFANLVAAARRRGMGIMLDMVFNHVSETHAWFQAACGPNPGPYRDYFIWADGPPEVPPDDQPAMFGGCRWRWVPEVGRHVLHSFCVEQVDLNWENPAVRRACAAVLRHWLGRGVEGFRFDVVDMIDKTPDRRHLLAYFGEMHRDAFAPHLAAGGRLVTVGEMPFATPALAAACTDPAVPGMDMVFPFDLPNLTPKWTAPATQQARAEGLKAVMGRWQQALNGRGWNSQYIGNHDWSRVVSRLGSDGVHRETSAKCLATMQFTHQGTAFVYQGEELGLPSAAHPRIEDYEDAESLYFFRLRTAAGMSPAEALAHVRRDSRDAARDMLPFAAGVPRAQRADPSSVLNHYRRLIALRRAEPAFVHGDYAALPSPPQVYAYRRRLGATTLHVVLNLGDAPQVLAEPEAVAAMASGESLLHSGAAVAAAPPAPPGHLPLAPWEARVVRTVAPAA